MKYRSDIHDFEKPSLTVDCVVFGYDAQKLWVLLVNRKKLPYQDKWALPGGFLSIDETFEMAIQRILVTKTGMQDLFMEQLYSFDSIGRDPRGRVISVAYYALVNPSKYNIINGFMNNDTQWFPLDELPELAFDHADILQCAYERLQGKIKYRPIGFELLDEEFTLPELQHIYEIILTRPLDRGNFRKKLLSLGIICPTGKKRAIGGHRSPDVYAFDKAKYDEMVRDGFDVNIV